MKPVLEKSCVIQHRLGIESQNKEKVLNSTMRNVHCLQHISFKSEDFPVCISNANKIQKFRDARISPACKSFYFAEIV